MKYALLATALGLVVGLKTAPAAAQDCQVDTDCYRGYSCQTVELIGCGGAPPCAPGEECPEPEPCPSEQGRQCRPLPCSTNADCDEGMVCYARTTEECSGGSPPCAGGAECPEPEPEQCVTTTDQLCVPRYVLPCTQALDCGAGFECRARERCDCGDSVSSPGSPDGGMSEPPPEPDCSCETVSVCELIRTACTTVADCPEDFSCVDNPEGSCSASSDGSPPVCEPADPAKLCMPPYYDLFGGGGVATDDGGALTPESGAPTRGTEQSSGGDSGGCRLSPVATGGRVVPALLLGLSLLVLGRRRVTRGSRR